MVAGEQCFPGCFLPNGGSFQMIGIIRQVTGKEGAGINEKHLQVAIEVIVMAGREVLRNSAVEHSIVIE
jgi:hypothetical protein